MSDKIGDVYDGSRKIGELHRSSGGLGGEGCLGIVLIVGLLIAGGILWGVTAINQARYGADSPADATITAEARAANAAAIATATAQTAYCISSRPSDATLADMAFIAYGGDQAGSPLQGLQVQSVTQDGCGLKVCTAMQVMAVDGSTEDQSAIFTFTYAFDQGKWVAGDSLTYGCS